VELLGRFLWVEFGFADGVVVPEEGLFYGSEVTFSKGSTERLMSVISGVYRSNAWDIDVCHVTGFFK